MAFFKKKPDPKLMGFLVNQASVNRIGEVIKESNDEQKWVLYALSTSIIACVLKQQYAPHIIENTLVQSDGFFGKQFKHLKNDTTISKIATQRNEWMNELNVENTLSLHNVAIDAAKKCEIDEQKLEECVVEWASVPLLISSNIKSE